MVLQEERETMSVYFVIPMNKCFLYRFVGFHRKIWKNHVSEYKKREQLNAAYTNYMNSVQKQLYTCIQ